jgi:PAS domain-containing protein
MRERGYYYIADNPDVSACAIEQARAARYDRLATALWDMGGGVVFDEQGDIVAFHERHAELLERRGKARMLNA